MLTGELLWNAKHILAINKKPMTEKQQEGSRLEISSLRWIEWEAEDAGESQQSSYLNISQNLMLNTILPLYSQRICSKNPQGYQHQVLHIKLSRKIHRVCPSLLEIPNHVIKHILFSLHGCLNSRMGNPGILELTR